MYKFKSLAILLVFSALPLLSPVAKAQDDDGDQTPPQDQSKPSDAAKKYDAAIKDATKYEGAFTFYVRKSDILLEISEDQLGRLFLAQATLNHGFSPMGGQAGEPISDGPIDVFKWERRDDKLILVRPHTKYRWDKDDPLAIASERTFPEAILGTFRIEQQKPDQKLLLVNVTSFFYGSVFGLPELVSEGSGGPASLDRELTDVDTIRESGDATVVRMNMHFRSQGRGDLADLMEAFGLSMPNHLEDAKSIPIQVDYTMWYRKDTDYKPREADARIGYFTQDFFSVSRFADRDRTERYIARFDLRKKDPYASMSEPVKPIVWYIDTSVPKEYRPGIRAGILAWNKAFEGIGFKNAIVVKDAPDNDPDWDHADGTHNLIRWNMSEDAAYAVSWFRIDPLSGEVLNAAVSIDANYAAVMMQQYNLLLRQASTEKQELSQEALLRPQEGQFDAAQMLVNGLNPETEAKREELAKLGWNRSQCDYAPRLAENAAMDWIILKAKGAKITQDDFMQEFIADLVMHEVGHCLGLRHNFAGSTQLSVKDLLDDQKVSTLGLSASVMDYTPLNTPAVLRGNGVFFNRTVGPYDMWAIQYGYSEFTDGKDSDHLAEIARRSGEPGHLFLTDEDADGVNPLGVRYDLGSDTLEWLKTEGIGNQSVRDYAINKVTKTGEGYGLRSALILNSFVHDARDSMMASRFVGGIEMRRMHKGDVNEKPTLAPVDPQIQRQAMRLIIDKTLMQKGVDLPDSVKVGLNLDPNGGSGAIWNAPLREIIGSNQISVLAALMSASKADDIAENAFKMEGKKDRYTIAEHYNMLFAAVFKEVGKNEDITSLRRDLQRFMVEGLITQASAPSGLINDDVRVVAAAGLGRLKTRFDKQIASSKGLDEMTVLHLKDISAQIDRFQKRTMVGGR